MTRVRRLHDCGLRIDKIFPSMRFVSCSSDFADILQYCTPSQDDLGLI